MKTISKNLFRKGSKQIKVLLLLAIIGLVACTGQKKEDSTTTQKTTEITAMQPAPAPANFEHKTANVNGINIHYVIGGKGEPLVLVHGFGQNWYMWNRIMPELSKHFTVIAPDLTLQATI
jgi:hypothetical protein